MFVPLDLLRVYIIYGQVDVIGFLKCFSLHTKSLRNLSRISLENDKIFKIDQV